MRNPIPSLRHITLGCLILSSTPCLAQTTRWLQVKTKNSPPARWVHGMAYDAVRGRTVLFGGQTGNNFRNDTWEYDGKDWGQIKPKTVPPARRYQSMVFHFASARTLMFGGAGNRFFNDTWTWDGGNWTLLKPKNSPPARMYHAMAYDSTRQRTVLFGGYDGRYLSDTWEWDGVNWTLMKPATVPTARRSHGMAYDSARKRIVLFGGWSAKTRQTVNDVWEYDGKDWVQMAPKTQPKRRMWFGMAYDMARQRTVVFGGRPDNYTWEYDGRDWTRMRPRIQPAQRTGNELMVYDSKRKRMVLHGGVALDQTRLTETWEYGALPTLTASPPTISIASGGTHTFSLDADTPNASRLYWIFGSVTGTSPGVTLASAVGSVNIPLNPDLWTDLTISLRNTSLLTWTRGTLGTAGTASAFFNVPKINSSSAIGVKFFHAYLVYDRQNNFFMASNPVELMLVK